MRVDVESSGKLGVAFIADDPEDPTDDGDSHFAAIQLERMESSASDLPRPYLSTSAPAGDATLESEDDVGSRFRERWHRDCEYYCPAGTGQDCAADGDASGLPQRCFYEMDFGMSLEEIEKGQLIPQAGFARGNFNYRFDEVAVNLVGTGVKNCEFSALPAACYGSNFLQYSIRQTGPYRIRNYAGDAVRASLYPGQVQQAKALLAERYLTNPISSADRGLLTDYWRNELRGRPMDGAFKLRIYDSDGLDWSRLEDVQLVTRYRYWTRLE